MDGSIILSTEKDIIAKKTYDEMYPQYKYISPKQLKINKAVALKGKTASYWNKMKSRNLSGLLKGEEQRLFKEYNLIKTI